MIHKGIEYSVSPTVEPDVWQWRFRIGNKTYAGKTRTRMAALASRRARLKIDVALKQNLPEADHGPVPIA
jgi:hypothetical protein